MKEIIREADVLCVGGGIAGLMAAIRAAELGAKVVVAEKANTIRSGSGATGNDHFRVYVPEFHGRDIEPIIEEIAHSQVGNTRSMRFVRTWLEKSFDIIQLWDSWGIPMKYEGNWEFAGHAFPGRPFSALKYAGKEQKPILTREARKRGVELVNRVAVFDLLVDRRVAGAIGVSTREDEITIFRAKSVVLATGGCVRLYPSPTPGWMFNRAYCPASTGDGRAMAYRAGAELINMEIPQRWAGPKYFARCGKATWVGVIRKPDGKPVGPFVTKPDRKYGDAIADAYHSLFEDYAGTGRGPVYMDCRGIAPKDYEYMMWWMVNEGNTALLNHLAEEGIDIRNNPVEFMTYELTCRGGINYNEKGETSLPGLYAAGDEYFGGISCAANFGWIAGDNAARYAEKAAAPVIKNLENVFAQKQKLVASMVGRHQGARWQEVNIALEQIMQDYAGPLRTETMLTAGLSHLRRLRDKACDTLMAVNQHELMHCLETLNLLDVGEVTFTAALERKETRGDYQRPDYPYANPVLSDKVLVCRKVDGKPVAEWQRFKE